MSSPEANSTPKKPPNPLNPPTKQQKLKFACDACARLKISCPKQQPECERCVSRGRRCVYSPACRLGKRKPSQSSAVKIVPSPGESQATSLLSKFAPSESKTLSTKSDTAVENRALVAPELTEFTTCNISVRPWDFTNGLPFPETCLSEEFGAPSEQPVTVVEPNETLLQSSYPYQDLSMFQFPDSNFSSPSVSSSSWPIQQSSPIITPPSSYTGTCSTTDSTPWPRSSCSSSPLTGQVETSLAIGEPGGLKLHEDMRQSCFTRLCSLLQILKRPSQKACIFEFDQPSYSQKRQDSTLDSMDKILFNTDRAIQHVTSVIKCACHSTPSVRCTLILTLFEVIAWYETITRILNQHEEEKNSSDPDSSSSPKVDEEGENNNNDNNSGSSRMQFESKGSEQLRMVSISAVSVGTMRLEQADSRKLLNFLVRARIEKVRGMLQVLNVNCSRSILHVDKLESVMAAYVLNGGQSDNAMTTS